MHDVPDTAIASRTTAALELLAVLCTRYPEAFMHEGDTPGAGDRDQRAPDRRAGP